MKSTTSKAETVNKTDKLNYAEFNEDLVFLLACLGRVPRGAQAAISQKATYVSRSDVNRLVKKGGQSGTFSMQRSQSVNAPKLRTIPREFVADKMGLDLSLPATQRLLKAANHQELKRLLDEVLGGLPPPDELISYATDTDIGDDPLVDRKALDAIADAFRGGSDRFLVVVATPHSGCGHALFSLHRVVGRSREQFVHVTPEPTGTSLEKIVEALCGHLGIGQEAHPNLTARTIAKKCWDEGLCIVIHNAHLLKTGGTSLLAFAQKFAFGRDERQSQTLLVLHYPMGLSPNRAMMKHDATEVAYAPASGDPGAVELSFREMIRYVHTHRGEEESAPHTYLREGPSHSRVLRQLELLQLSSLHPNRSSLLLRAAALADKRLIEIEDPTLGFDGIVGDRLLETRPEFRRLRYDILAVLGAMSERRLSAVRLISTTAHWLTQEMVEDIHSSVDIAWSDVVELVDDSGLGLASWRRDPKPRHTSKEITEEPQDEAGVRRLGDPDLSRVRSPLTIKSVVQEHWRRSDPKSYVKVHLALAKALSRLSQLSLNPDEQERQDGRFSREYFHICPPEGPYIIYSTEAVRYAARAYSATWYLATGYQGAKSGIDKIRQDCGKIIETELERLDGETGLDRPGTRSSHVLSRRFGRYQLKLELLHIVSENNRGEKPLDILSSLRRQEFHREMGVARFGLLHPILAWDSFGKGLQNGTSPDLRLDCLLHRASLGVITHSFAASQRCIDEAKTYRDLLEDDAQRQRLDRRVAVRSANLARARGDLALACGIFDNVLDHKAKVPLDGDAAIACIDAFIDHGTVHREYLEKAIYLAELNSAHLDREHNIHEASRFDIRRARVLSLLGFHAVSEAILDDIALSLLVKGGSSRLFLDFCLAAGETMIAHKHFEWAYAGYLKPGADIAKENLLKVSLIQFARPALVCLNKIRQWHERHDAMPLQEAQSILLEKLRRESTEDVGAVAWPPLERRRFLFSEFVRLSEQSRSIYHGFDLKLRFEQQGQWATKLADREFVLAEIDLLKSQLRETGDTGIFNGPD